MVSVLALCCACLSGLAQVQGWGDGVGIGFWSILGPAVWALAGLDALLWSGCLLYTSDAADE